MVRVLKYLTYTERVNEPKKKAEGRHDDSYWRDI